MVTLQFSLAIFYNCRVYFHPVRRVSFAIFSTVGHRLVCLLFGMQPLEYGYNCINFGVHSVPFPLCLHPKNCNKQFACLFARMYHMNSGPFNTSLPSTRQSGNHRLLVRFFLFVSSALFRRSLADGSRLSAHVCGVKSL